MGWILFPSYFSLLPFTCKFLTFFTKPQFKLLPLTLTYILRIWDLHIPFNISPIIIQVLNGHQTLFYILGRYSFPSPRLTQLLNIQSLHMKFLCRLFNHRQYLPNYRKHHIAISITVSSRQRRFTEYIWKRSPPINKLKSICECFRAGTSCSGHLYLTLWPF